MNSDLVSILWDTKTLPAIFVQWYPNIFFRFCRWCVWTIKCLFRNVLILSGARKHMFKDKLCLNCQSNEPHSFDFLKSLWSSNQDSKLHICLHLIELAWLEECIAIVLYIHSWLWLLCQWLNFSYLIVLALIYCNKWIDSMDEVDKCL